MPKAEVGWPDAGWPKAGWPKTEEGVVVFVLPNTEGVAVFVLPNAEGVVVVFPNADGAGAPNTDPKADLTGAALPNAEVLGAEAFPNAEGVALLPNTELEEVVFDPCALFRRACSYA